MPSFQEPLTGNRGAWFAIAILAFVLCACASSTHVQTTSNGNGGGGGGGSAPAGNTPSADPTFVYISGAGLGGMNQIDGFSVAANGALTPLYASPFAGNVTSLAAAGGQLFALNQDGVNLESYSISSDGSLVHEKTTNDAQPGNCNQLGDLFTDTTAATLYALNFRGSECANNTYESFAIDASTGALTDLGNSSANDWLTQPASFLPDDVHAVTASCIADMFWGIWEFSRSSSGLLTQLSISIRPPAPPNGFFYCPSAAAADAGGFVAIAMQPVDQQTFSPTKPAQLASYTEQANGDLATTNTAATMPTVAVGIVDDMTVSPAGDLLAVAGSSGLQVFHFSGAITPYTGLLTSDEIDEVSWDSQGHLYALSRPAGKLYVFTVTASSYAQATGSPYAIDGAQDLAVDFTQ